MRQREVMYRGYRVPDGCLVTRNDVRLWPTESLKIRRHSPAGFAWGYSGSGPAQLALALLLDATNDVVIAQRYYQRFKFEVISQLPREGEWSLDLRSIMTWLDLRSQEDYLVMLQRVKRGGLGDGSN